MIGFKVRGVTLFDRDDLSFGDGSDSKRSSSGSEAFCACRLVRISEAEEESIVEAKMLHGCAQKVNT